MYQLTDEIYNFDNNKIESFTITLCTKNSVEEMMYTYNASSNNDLPWSCVTVKWSDKEDDYSITLETDLPDERVKKHLIRYICLFNIQEFELVESDKKISLKIYHKDKYTAELPQYQYGFSGMDPCGGIYDNNLGLSSYYGYPPQFYMNSLGCANSLIKVKVAGVKIGKKFVFEGRYYIKENKFGKIYGSGINTGDRVFNDDDFVVADYNDVTDDFRLRLNY